ncbi:MULTISPECIES: hypothetical protein [Vibrio]|uniref:hypothetical protein n=1 Tax=Vibrio TaxID=662 RepID=UPI00021A9F42|nr:MULTISPECIES: hypothetical protein [Vibrio]EGR1024203.1 hypothetical protein [Vibrio cholerae]EGS58676.1 hypothetical protein VCHC02A1_3195 [Vibrio cholerae HC-02A1]EJR5450037.1 hypothetical protein [Vibrio cholerae]EKF9157800.1 hypothetical protein [Vibrio cholerae]EKF9389003.1 hypothetical protein [Vibrio cholerae]
MGDWEDVFGSAGMQPDFAPWDEPGWADDHETLDDEEKYMNSDNEYDVNVRELNETLILLRNLLERAQANKKIFTTMETKAINHAILVLSKKDNLDNEADADTPTPSWGQPQPSKLNEAPMDFDDDIPF